VARTVPTGLVGPGGEPVPLARLRGERVLAWAGIGHPAAFEGTLADAGAVVAGRLRAADHHAPGPADVRRAAEAARAAGASRIVVTRKDLAKLRALPDLPAGLVALDAATEVVEGEAGLLRVALPAARSRASS
jgi:tetraacyldisaccharide 4'-kinase